MTCRGFAVRADRTLPWLAVPALVLLAAPLAAPLAAQPVARPADPPVAPLHMLADFVAGPPPALQLLGARGEVIAERPLGASPGSFRLAPIGDAARAAVVLPVPQGIDAGAAGSLAAWVRVEPSGRSVPLRWLALDQHGRVRLQRRVVVPGGGWTHVAWPLLAWRWGDEFTGDWSAVRALALRVEAAVESVGLDDVALLAPPVDAGAWLTDLAFAGRVHSAAARDGLLVATDAPAAPGRPGLTPDDLAARLARMAHTRDWLRRLCPTAFQPASPGAAPVALLIFADEAGYRGLFDRLGEAWAVSIEPPMASGYTVQTITASFFDPLRGADRPVYTHEVVHGLAAQHLGLLPGHPRHGWLQEGLANYLQLALHPDSLPRHAYVAHFARGVDPAGGSFFKPLASLVDRRLGLDGYAQAASLVAFLIEEQPDWLDALAGGLAVGRTTAAVAAELGLTLDDLQARWLAWGRGRFGVGSTGEVHWPVPVEFGG